MTVGPENEFPPPRRAGLPFVPMRPPTPPPELNPLLFEGYRAELLEDLSLAVRAVKRVFQDIVEPHKRRS